MKTSYANLLALILGLLTPVLLMAQDGVSSPIDVLHYEFNISVNDNNDEIKGSASITLMTIDATKVISLELGSPRKDGKGMNIASVSNGSMQLPFKHSADQLLVTIPEGLKKADTLVLKIRYSGIPADGLIISKNKYQHRTFFGDNWPNRAHAWLPCKDDPSDKATVNFNITAPDHYQVISNGTQVEETNLPQATKLTRFVEKVEVPTKVMVIGIADFSSQLLDEVNGIPISAWVYPEDRDLAAPSFRTAAASLRFLVERVGPYPYQKLANVQSKTIYGGLENANTIFYYENAVTPGANNESLVMHEISHQWFGNSATETAFGHLWLSEGMATYITHLFIENKYGHDSLLHEMAKDRLTVTRFYQQRKKPVVDLDTKNYMDLLNSNSYQKGSWVLHMLRTNVGDSIFWQGIRRYYAAYKGKNASTEDFQRIMEQVSGKNLATFFRQWFYTAGHPDLLIRHHYKQGELTVSFTQQQSNLFEFPLDIELVMPNQDRIKKSIQISGNTTSIAIPLAAAPKQVIIDPATTLLAEWNVIHAE